MCPERPVFEQAKYKSPSFHLPPKILFPVFSFRGTKHLYNGNKVQNAQDGILKYSIRNIKPSRGIGDERGHSIKKSKYEVEQKMKVEGVRKSKWMKQMEIWGK